MAETQLLESTDAGKQLTALLEYRRLVLDSRDEEIVGK